VASNSQLTLEFANPAAENTNITVTTLTGEKIFETVTKGRNYVFKAQQLKSGMYIVSIRNCSSNATQKLMVK
jgi:hypothetical protein